MTLPDRQSEQQYIHKQYRTRDNLQIRILTHEQYSQPKIDFHKWVLDLIPWTGRETVLDVGCGSGMYAEPVSQRCRRYIAADLSIGMLRGLANAVTEKVNMDASVLPVGGGTIDVVLANHMLYHVRELNRTLMEIYRVLKPGGVLIAATNAKKYMPELSEVLARLAGKLGVKGYDQWENLYGIATRFTLENGRQALEPVYANVARHDLPGALVFKEASPLIDYLGSMQERYEFMYSPGLTWQEIAGALRDEIDMQIAKNGEFRINKLAGVFVCKKEMLQSSG